MFLTIPIGTNNHLSNSNKNCDSPMVDQAPNIELHDRGVWVECLHWDLGLPILHSTTLYAYTTSIDRNFLLLKIDK